VSVYAVLPGPIDTDVVRHLELPMTPPEDVARARLDRVERGDEDIFPDSMSQLLAEGWRVGVGKTLERLNVALVDGRADRGLSEKTAPMRATMTTHAIVSRDEWQDPGPCLSGRRHTPGWATSGRDSDGRFLGADRQRSTRCERPPDRNSCSSLLPHALEQLSNQLGAYLIPNVEDDASCTPWTLRKVCTGTSTSSSRRRRLNGWLRCCRGARRRVSSACRASFVCGSRRGCSRSPAG